MEIHWIILVIFLNAVNRQNPTFSNYRINAYVMSLTLTLNFYFRNIGIQSLGQYMIRHSSHANSFQHQCVPGYK